MTRLMKRILLVVGVISLLLAFITGIVIVPLVIATFFYHSGTYLAWAIVTSIVFPITFGTALTTLGLLKR